MYFCLIPILLCLSASGPALPQEKAQVEPQLGRLPCQCHRQPVSDQKRPQGTWSIRKAGPGMPLESTPSPLSVPTPRTCGPPVSDLPIFLLARILHFLMPLGQHSYVHHLTSSCTTNPSIAQMLAQSLTHNYSFASFYFVSF